MTLAVITPTTASDTIDLAGPMELFRKQVLRKGRLTYKGRVLNFDDDYLRKLVANFREGATGEQVAYQLADRDNNHTLDPERYRGEIVGAELTDDGLDVLMRPATAEAATELRKNKRLGVSVRILEDFARDGKTYGPVLDHVLGTLSPRMRGMRPWSEEVSLSEVEETLDLSGEEYDAVGDTQDEETEVEETESTDETTEDDESTEDSDEDEADETDGDETDLSDDGEDEKEVEMTENDGDPGAVELAQANARIAALEADNARQRFDRYAGDLVRDGVPPVMIELARPVLELPAEAVIELSDNSSVNVADTIRALLEECRGTVELAKERGHSFNKPQTAQQREDDLLKNWEV